MEDARKEFILDIGDGVLSGLHASIRPGRWWRVIEPDGSLWCETSSVKEARNSMRPGDRLERWWEIQVPGRWVPELAQPGKGGKIKT